MARYVCGTSSLDNTNINTSLYIFWSPLRIFFFKLYFDDKSEI